MHSRDAQSSEHETAAAIAGGLGLFLVGVVLAHFFGWAAVVLLVGLVLIAAALVA